MIGTTSRDKWGVPLVEMNSTVIYFAIFSLRKLAKIQEQIYTYLRKVGPSSSKKICDICFIESPFKMMKNEVLSEDTYFFITNFWSCMKNGLIRKMRLISKFMTSQPG